MTVMFILNAQTQIVSFDHFDRFLYAQAAVVLAVKTTNQQEYTTDIVN